MSTTRKPTRIPEHVAIIMDGNGRWARKRGLPRIAGHRAGSKNIRPVVKAFAERGVKVLTLYAFSTENWSRPKEEVEGLLKLITKMIDEELDLAQKENIRFQHIGKLDGLPTAVRRKVEKVVQLTRGHTGITVCVAFNYGGRSEIVEAARKIISQQIPAERLSEDVFGHYLDTAGLPDPDLVIRTGGEMRLSNFLIWQTAYAELYSTPTFWPDFSDADVEKALAAYSKRERRFGSLKPGV